MPGTDTQNDFSSNNETEVGRRLGELRVMRGFFLCALAERSGLNINTLSLIENGKTSPSVSTLQQLAHLLKIPITVFFEPSLKPKHVVFTPNAERPITRFDNSTMQNLGQNLAGSDPQAFGVTLQPGEGNSEPLIVHTEHEFVYGLAGTVEHRVAETIYHVG